MDQKAAQANDNEFLLTKTLSIIWENYLSACDDSEAKLHWLELFLFYFQYAEDDVLQSEIIKSSINNIPEEIISYLLETVCNIINQSHLSTKPVPAHSSNTDLVQTNEISINETKGAISLNANRSFTPLIVNAPGDWSKIIALREFLTNDLGKHLLRFLLRVDNKLIASQKGLCNLCINLFPNCIWNAEEIELETTISILAAITNISKNVKKDRILGMPERSKNAALPKSDNKFEKDLQCFKNAIASSDEIAFMLIKLMSKCVANECDNKLNSQSVSVIALNFALECLCSNDDVYKTKRNANKIKFELLLLIIHCVNNIFIAAKSLHVLKFQNVFAKLSEILKKHAVTLADHNVCDKFHLEFLSAINYILFYTLQNIITFSHKDKTKHTQIRGNKSNLHDIKFIDESIIDTSIETFEQILLQLNTATAINAEAKTLNVLTFKILIKINEQLCKHDQLVRRSSTTSAYPIGSHMRRRSPLLRQIHCQMQVPTLCCFFQGVLIHLLPNIPYDMQHYVLRYLFRVGVCCCHYTLDTYSICLRMVPKLTAKYQNCIYKFLHRRLLCTIFEQEHGDVGGFIKRYTEHCNKCDVKLKSQEFRREILQFYKELHEELMVNSNENCSKIEAEQLLLKHLKNLSHTLSSDMANGILSELVLPTFRSYKEALFKSYRTNDGFVDNGTTPRHIDDSSLHITEGRVNKTKKFENQEITISIIQDCLNIVVAYLRLDIRLIKAFYNEENIAHLEKLFNVPPLLHSVCDLIKIGIDNVTFLGETDQEQTLLSQRLILLLLKNSADNATHFNEILKHAIGENSVIKSIKDVTYTCKLGVVDILYIVALQWSFIYELLQSNQYFFNAFATMYNLNDASKEIVFENTQPKVQVKNEQDCNKMSIKHLTNSLSFSADKTIVDVLTLNFNALNVFLKLSQCKNLHTSQRLRTTTTAGAATTTTLSTNHLQSSAHHIAHSEANKDKENCCLSSSLESLLSSIEVDALQQTFQSHSSSFTTTERTLTAKPTQRKLNLHQYTPNSYSSINDTALSSTESVNLSFLSNLKSHRSLNFEISQISKTPCEDSIVVFDIRNQVSARITENSALAHTSASALNTSSVDKVATTTVWNCAADILSTSTLVVGSETHAAVRNIGTSIIGKLFSVLGSIFGGTNNTNSINDSNTSSNDKCFHQEVDEKLIGLLEKSADSEKYLLRLFETTMAISIKSFQQEGAATMDNHLLKLKSVILSSAFSNWNQAHGQEHTQENAVVKALQSLLKMAEQINSSSSSQAASADFNNSNGFTIDDANEDMMLLTTPLRPRARSFNSTKTQKTKSHNSGPNSPRTPVAKRPTLVGETNDADYLSTRMSVYCESEMELSDCGDNDDNYITADEGYEADGEVLELSESELEFDKVEFWSSFQPSSRYRTHLLHNGLCNLVVQILIELSERCLLNPVGWCEALAQLANRLFVIRAYIGDSLFLLRGFAPVLKRGDPQLRELQQALLELIVDINTPEVTGTYFNILAAKSPPVDLLIKYLNHICVSKMKKPQPMVELEFPITIDGTCTSTCDQRLTMDIDRLRNQHINAHITTPLSRTPCIIPISHARLWNNDGFTLSFWMQMKGTSNSKATVSPHLEDEKRNLFEDSLKTHIISIGTNQVMLSAYVDSNMRLIFETCKPNTEIKTQTKTPAEQANESVEDKNQIPTQNTPTNEKEVDPNTDPASATNPSTLRVALKQTKLVILNSFSNMHLFKYHTNKQTYERSIAELKEFRFVKNHWTHITMGVCTQQDHLELTIYIDGVEQEVINLHFRNIRGFLRTHAFQIICLGDSTYSINSSNENTESRSTVDGYPMPYSISNLLLFNGRFTAWETISNLTAMGPDFAELAPLQINSWRPNYGFVNLSKLKKAQFGNVAESMKLLYEMRMLVYTAESPDIVMGYNSELNTREGSITSAGRVYGLILYGELLQNHLRSMQTATMLCGGLSTHMFLFARTVEMSSNSMSQYMALDFFLNVALSDAQLYAEFLRLNYMNMIGYVIKTDRCTKDVQLLRSIVNNACSLPLINKKAESLEISENTTAIIVYPQLIITVLHRYSDWHRSGVEHSDVLDMLLLCILALTHEKHPHRDFNLDQLNEAGLLKELLNLCKVYVIESPNPVYISKNAAESFVAILSVFAGSPPSASLMDEIMKLTLLLQKPSECYITHDRSKFYFLLTPQPPKKERSTTGTSFNRVASPFRRHSKRERPGVAVSASNVNTNDASLAKSVNEKIKRLRKFHIINATSPFKRNLLEFEDNLENTADCARLNKKALRQLNHSDIESWRTRFKYNFKWNSPTICNSQIANRTERRTDKYLSISSCSPNKISHKRMRHVAASHALNAENLKVKMSQKMSTSIHSIDCTSSTSGKENVSNHHLGLSSMPATCPQRRSRFLVKTDFYNTPGIIALQEGLLTLLKNFLCLLPDNAVEEVLKHYVKVDIILILSNNCSCAVRTAIIKLLALLLKRLQPNDIAQHVKSLYPQHLANQMSIYPTDMQMFEACLEWVTGLYSSSSIMLACDITPYIVDRFGINTLLSIVTNMANNQNINKITAFKILYKMFDADAEQQQLLIEAGLLLCCIKSIFNLYSNSSVVDASLESAILILLTKIGEKSLKSVGHIKIVWDILNMLTFLHGTAAVSVIKNIRSAQARLLQKWICMFFEWVNEPKSFKVIALPYSTLSLNETKERLRLLIDRCAQFFTTCDVNYIPSAPEVELFQLIVTFHISTNQRYNNFIAWGLQPSRPRELRQFIVNALWNSCQGDLLPSVICDGKIIKSFLWLCLLEDMEEPLENLEQLCKLLGINEHDSTWNLENELERIELNRIAVSAEQKVKLEETVYRFEALAVSCIESSMLTTRRVAELQNAERKLLIYQLKDYDDASIYTKWLSIVRRMTHEGAPWYSKERAENDWELDDTEGPSRVHTRLRRCHMDIDRRFFMEDYYNSELRSNDIPFDFSASSNTEYIRPLEYLLSSYDQQLNISLNSQILYNFPAKFLPVDGEIDGEIILTDHKLYFMATYRCKYFYINCDISSINEIWLKRYQHQEKAFEIFLDTNQSLFFSLQNQEDYKIMYDVFCDKIVTHPDQTKILVITQQWREGLLTNWEYLMTLNQIAGRTYNDLMQYPIFPWILSNYATHVLDLTEVGNFRKLDKPVAVQHIENEQHYINNYTYINNSMTNMGSMTLKPYHYSSHYSNSGTVLHFLVRVPPFTSYFLRYQDNNFDLPDRTFHSLNTTWNLASRDSPTDVKELIPEFFCLPEMFENFERFNFGCRQNGERVEDVQLPPWCQRDARLFILIHRQALEAELVRNHLHHWIDLIFGYKQTGESAVEAINVFHPATYPSFLDSVTSDPIERKAVETMIKTYGQMPRQLFKNVHPQTKTLNYCLGAKDVLSTVRGLRWGVYLGSPQLPTPTLGNIYKIAGAEYLVSFNNTNVVYGLPAKSCIMQGAEVDTFNVISWDYDDHIVRIQPLNKLYTKPKNILRSNVIDDITACGSDPNSNQLWFGHKSGRISIYKCASADINSRPVKSRQNYIRGLRRSYNSAFRKLTTKSFVDESDTSNVAPLLSSAIGAASSDAPHRDSADLIWSGPNILLRHTDEITSIRLSVEFKIAVSAGRDGIAVIWDLNNWNYIRTIERPAEIHHSPITVIAISPTLGDIVTVHSIPQPLVQKSATELQQNENDNKYFANGEQQQQHVNDALATSPTAPDECFEVTEESLDDFVNVSINPNGKSILRLHTANARYVQHIVNEDRILAATYSYIKEGVGVNVIATAIEGGTIRLWSSWNLSFVSEIITGISNIKSISYSTHQHLVALTKDSHIQVWESEGLYGNSPKFPQIAYK
ncbi:lysosomal-trafficking regulator [Eurosta solidaginis]|uniref:lysosomal-trafficking regulator n=1 Tax=Eurosta solidaginis TaxID=178769 RepID=UPI003531030E